MDRYPLNPKRIYRAFWRNETTKVNKTKRAATAALFLFPIPGARASMLAPCSPQALAPSSGHANIGAVFPARGLSGWRLASRKPLFLRRATPTPAPFFRRATFPVGALLPASPCFFVGPRQQRRRYPGARPFLLAPCSPQALAPSSGHANRGAVTPARGLFGSRLAPRKPLRLRQATPT